MNDRRSDKKLVNGSGKSSLGIPVQNEEASPWKSYGKFTAYGFYLVTEYLFYPHSGLNDTDIRVYIVDCNKRLPDWQKEYVEAFRLFLADPAMSLTEKACSYLNDHFPEGSFAEEAFRACWNLVAPNEPWPLDQK